MCKSSELNSKQKTFCEEYVVDHNGKQAAIRAGYAPDYAERQASQMLEDSRFKLYISKLEEEKRERNQITQDDLIRELKYILFNDVSDIFNPETKTMLHPVDMPVQSRHAVSSYKETEKFDRDGNPITQREVRFWSKDQAIEKTMKHLGMLVDRVDVKFEDFKEQIMGVIAELPDETRQAVIDKIRNQFS